MFKLKFKFKILYKKCFATFFIIFATSIVKLDTTFSNLDMGFSSCRKTITSLCNLVLFSGKFQWIKLLYFYVKFVTKFGQA